MPGYQPDRRSWNHAGYGRERNRCKEDGRGGKCKGIPGFYINHWCRHFLGSDNHSFRDGMDRQHCKGAWGKRDFIPLLQGIPIFPAFIYACKHDAGPFPESDCDGRTSRSRYGPWGKRRGS